MVRVYHSRKAEMSQDPLAMGLNPKNPIIHDYHPGPSIVCPLDVNERTIGILGVTSDDVSRLLNDSDKEYVQTFANNIAAAFERERLDGNWKQSLEERTRLEKENLEERARLEKQRLEERARLLEQSFEERTRIQEQSYEGAVLALVKALEVNDTFTAGHSERVSKISVKIARRLGYDGTQLDDIRFGCILHDLGKIGQWGYKELAKDARLTREEYELIKEHPVRGAAILEKNTFFKASHRKIVRNHHERWDGTGYPDRLAGDTIPPEAQIVAVADAYDAMTADRPYRKGMPTKQAIDEIIRCTGTQFSPKVVEAFLYLYEHKGLNGDTEK